MPLLLKYVIWCEYDNNVCCLQCAWAMFAHSGVVTSGTSRCAWWWAWLACKEIGSGCSKGWGEEWSEWSRTYYKKHEWWI